MDSLERVEHPGADRESADPAGHDGQLAHGGLFSYGGPFDLHPGPVLALGQNAMVLAANAAAQPIVEMLRQGPSPVLEEAFNAALSGRVAQINPFLVPAQPAAEPESGCCTSAYDLLLLPWAEKLAVLMLGREITVDRSLRTALVDSRQRFKDLVEISSDLAWETDRAGCFTFVSAGEALGHRSEDMIGRPAADFLVVPVEDEANPFAGQDPVDGVQVWFRRADGSTACLAVTAVPLRGADGGWAGARGLCRDISAEQARDAELSAARAREQLLAYVLRNVRDETEPRDAIQSILSILRRGFALDGLTLYQGEELTRHGAAGFAEVARLGDDLPEAQLREDLEALADDPAGSARGSDQEVQGLTLLPTRHRDEVNGALALYRADPQRPWTQRDGALLDEIALHLGATMSQLSRQEALQRLSDSDPLTGLMNRRGFMRGLEIAHKRCVAERKTSALFFVDLNNFKAVNDRLGHRSGDELLQAVAARLGGLVRERDLVARLGGDEFAVLLMGLSAEQAARRARDMAALGETLRRGLSDPGIAFGLSVGVAMLDPERPLDGEALLAEADRAMYRAKAEAKAAAGGAPLQSGAAG